MDFRVLRKENAKDQTAVFRTPEKIIHNLMEDNVTW